MTDDFYTHALSLFEDGSETTGISGLVGGLLVTRGFYLNSKLVSSQRVSIVLSWSILL